MYHIDKICKIYIYNIYFLFLFEGECFTQMKNIARQYAYLYRLFQVSTFKLVICAFKVHHDWYRFPINMLIFKRKNMEYMPERNNPHLF